MTGEELMEIRTRLELSPAQFGSLLGYRGNRNTLDLLIRRYEGGIKEIPLYLARYIWLLDIVHAGRTGEIEFYRSGQIKWPLGLRLEDGL